MNTQIYDEASEWIILHRSDSLDNDARRRFDAWLRESPQHLRAYLEMSTIWEDVPALNRDWNPSANELIARARQDANIFPLARSAIPAEAGIQALGLRPENLAEPEYLPSPEPKLQTVSEVTVPASQHSSFWRYTAAAAAMILIAVATGWFYLQRGVYTTDIGEQRTIALLDGSTIELNARTKLRVHYTDQERSIDLIQGQALFKVAKDPNRPFIVDSDGTLVRAVGTQFDVYKKNTGTQITVVEGRVAVATPSSPVVPAKVEIRSDTQASGLRPQHSFEAHLGEVLVSAGEQILIADATPTPQLPIETSAPEAAASDTQALGLSTQASFATPQPANIEAATAWTQQRLVFDFATLNEVAEEFNRYNHRRLIIDCDGGNTCLSDFHISGSFSSSDPTLLLRFLRDQPGIVVNETADEIRISRQDANG